MEMLKKKTTTKFYCQKTTVENDLMQIINK